MLRISIVRFTQMVPLRGGGTGGRREEEEA